MAGNTRHDRTTEQRRQLLVLATVRLLAQDETLDVHAALGKAMRQTGIRDPDARPSLDTLRRAFEEHRRLFATAEQDRHAFWRAALPAMEALHPFSPRLCEDGIEQMIRLHLHCDTPESVAHWIEEHQIPAQPRDRRIRLDRQRSVDVPTWEFTAGQWPVELWVLPEASLRQPPLAPGSDQPQSRASAALLRNRLEDAAD